MSSTEDLLTGVAAVNARIEEARNSLYAARQQAEETVGAYAALGGSAGRAQLVHEAIDEICSRAGALTDSLDDASGAVAEIGPELTPEESAEKLGSALQHIQDSSERVAGTVEAIDEAITGTQGNLEGSSAADEICTTLGQARDELEQVLSALESTRHEAEEHQAAFRGN